MVQSDNAAEPYHHRPAARSAFVVRDQRGRRVRGGGEAPAGLVPEGVAGALTRSSAKVTGLAQKVQVGPIF